MEILVIDQCSKAKEYRSDSQSFEADEIDEHGMSNLRDRPRTSSKAARKLYAGRQQEYINDAVDKLRSAGDSVDRYFISAGFGLVRETEELPPYDVTFTDDSQWEIEKRASKLGIQHDLLDVVTDDYDIIFLALGSDYYATFDLLTVVEAVSAETWVVCFNHDSVSETVENAVSLSARTEDAKEQGTIVVALKGRYLQNFASHRSQGKQVTSTDDIETFCTTESTTQTGLDQVDK